MSVTEAVTDLAVGLGVTLPADLTEADYAAIAAGLIADNASTVPAFNRVVERVRDQRRALERDTMAKVAQVFEFPRRPAAYRVHPACKAAWIDGATPCWRCLPLLCERLDCDHDACQYALAHLDDDDDRRGASV